MKKIIFVLLLALTSLSLQAQPQRRGGEGKGNPQEFQIALMIKQLNLDEQQGDQFKELYTQYSTEMSKLRVRPQRKANERPTEEQIEEQILNSFSKAEQSNDLKREYYSLFKEILTPHQILRMYNIEREFQERLNAEHQRRTSKQPN
ncbi:MAG: hypothetical protein SNI51_01745 [Rikenellaceae bacterium]